MSYIYTLTCYRDRPFRQRSATWTETIHSTCDLTGLIRPGAWLVEEGETLQNPVIKKITVTHTPHRVVPARID